MFTIKHITLNGSETLYYHANVRYEPEGISQGVCEEKGAYKSPPRILLQGHEPPWLDGGTVFVMNDLGKTVARYDLGASNVPLPKDVIRGIAAARQHASY